MKNPWDRWVSIDISDTINHNNIREAKRGSKRFCGRIVDSGRDAVTNSLMSASNESPDLIFDSTSLIHPWYR